MANELMSMDVIGNLGSSGDTGSAPRDFGRLIPGPEEPPTGPSRGITNLRQLIELSSILKASGMPDFLSRAVIQGATGISIPDPKEQAIRGVMAQIALRHKLGAPGRQETRNIAREGLELRKESSKKSAALERQSLEQQKQFQQESLRLRKESVEQREMMAIKNLQEALQLANFDPSANVPDPQTGLTTKQVLSRLYLQKLLSLSSASGPGGQSAGQPGKSAKPGSSKIKVRRLD